MPRALLTLVVGFRPGDKPRVLLNLGVKKTEPQSWVIWRGTGGPALPGHCVNPPPARPWAP